jgi:hypothetical protein
MSTEEKNNSAWDYLKEIGVGERHFNEIESKYRALASTWLLASFAGMGFVATSVGLPLSKEIVIFAISLAGTCGIQLLWVVDLLAYHHLLAAYYLEGLKIEASDPHLPQIGWNIWKQGIVETRLKLFYAGCSVALLPFGLGALLASYKHTELTGLIGVALVLVAICCSTLLWKKSTNAWLYTEVDKIIR